MFRAFTDASVKDTNAGIGYVIYKNETPIYTCRKRSTCSKSTKLEYIAVLDLLKFINEKGIKNIEVYTDSECLTEQLKHRGSGKLIKDDVIRDILYELALNPTITIKWVPREYNNIAHILSREAMQGLEDKVSSKHIDKIHKHQKNHETKMVIKYRRSMFLKCPACGEKKAATEFPRYKDGKKNRKCNACEQKIQMISLSYIKIKNTY